MWKERNSLEAENDQNFWILNKGNCWILDVDVYRGEVTYKRVVNPTKFTEHGSNWLLLSVRIQDLSILLARAS